LNVHGFVGRADVNRSSAFAIHSFVNRRFVRDRLFQHAVMEGYRNLLPRHRYPVVILFLEVPPDLVDVNVHPAKREVRFRQQGTVHDFIANSIQEALRAEKPFKGEEKTTWDNGFLPASENREKAGTGRPYPVAPQETRQSFSNGVREDFTGLKPVPDADESRASQVDPGDPEELISLMADEPAVQSKGYFSSLRVLGQYHNSFIVCQSKEDLIFIDQHAAHERIGFERLKTQFEKGRIEVQELLFPKNLEFGFQEAAALEENLENLLQLGFGIEPYGGKTFVLRSIPAVLDPELAEQVLKEILEEIATLGKSQAMTQEVDKTLITMACHSMVRANQPLSPAEIKSLLHDMDAVDFSTHCPHGRPAVVRLSLQDVEKMFHRT
jgi:DNA mismatch repair protein MutL